nr:YgcG family protein [Treponema phagedenis]
MRKQKLQGRKNTVKKRIAFFIFFVLCFIATALEVPPLKEPVTDLAGVLDTAEHTKISDFLTKLDTSSQVQIAVLIIPSLEGESLEDYSMQVAEKWKIGQKGKDSGVILLIANDEHKIRIEVGYGLEGFITDAKASSIIRNVIAPEFKKNNYGEGIYQAVQNLAGLALEDESLISDKLNTEEDSDGTPWLLIIIIVAVFLLVGGLQGKRRSGSPSFGRGFSSGIGGGFSGDSGNFGGGGGFSSGGGSSFSGGGGSFGGGGASGGW